jgi:peptidoglycan biosynthesis protein MviN/MurJ (putative lipid II flippase)
VRNDANRAGLGSLVTGAVTALGIAVQTGLAAVVGVVIARKLGRTAETDGFFAAYGVFIVLALAATAVRVTVLPSLARAREAGRLSSETASYALAVGIVALPLLGVTVVAARPIAELLTGFGPDTAVDAAASALPWMVVAGLGQFTAGLLASTLAALDDYVAPALAFIAGSVTGLALLLVRIDESRTQAVAWGMALNAVLATSLMALWLWREARRERMPAAAARADVRGSGRRLLELGSGAALPFALQAVYLVCLPIAAREGVGSVTSFGYAYLIAAAVVGISASSVGLVTAVPLTRLGLEPERVARHIEASSWPALLVVAATAGIFAVAGAEIAARVLGAAYGDDVGSQIARLVVAMAPYMVASVALSVTFPLVFVAGRGARLPLVGLGVLALHVPVAFAGQALFGLEGLAVALAVSTAVAFAWMLTFLQAARSTIRRLAVAVAVVAGCAVAGFVPAGALLGQAAAAVAGLALSGAVLALVRPVGLRAAWHYLRELA